MDKTGIIWTEKTWNPLSGCQKVSQGCKYCYAETIAKKYAGQSSFPNGFDLTLRPHKLKEPLAWKEPSLVFVNSMSDLFWDKVPNEYRHKVLDIIEQTPQHEYQVLTKRPEAMLAFSKERKLPLNFWAGTTIEDAKALPRLQILQQIEASIRFISFEPLIGQIPFSDFSGIHWVITGGESGAHLWNAEVREKRALVEYANKKWVPREDRIDWVRAIRDNCKDFGTHFFHKQWGGAYPEAAGRLLDGRTYNEIPRLPGNKTEINNDYLHELESRYKQLNLIE